jgi:hypothetical protein
MAFLEFLDSNCAYVRVSRSSDSMSFSFNIVGGKLDIGAGNYSDMPTTFALSFEDGVLRLATKIAGKKCFFRHANHGMVVHAPIIIGTN